MDGQDGSWAVSATSFSVDSMNVAVDEDHFNNGDRAHTTEQVNYSYIVFSTAGPVILTTTYRSRQTKTSYPRNGWRSYQRDQIRNYVR
jgi:hypothetical protein